LGWSECFTGEDKMSSESKRDIRGKVTDGLIGTVPCGSVMIRTMGRDCPIEIDLLMKFCDGRQKQSRRIGVHK
jgi:hypothetical protein